MQQPYFCPNCRSNRVKFSVISNFSQSIRKDAVTGDVIEQSEPQPMASDQPSIQCEVCSFIGNEMRFVKQAEREPRQAVQTTSVYPS